MTDFEHIEGYFISMLDKYHKQEITEGKNFGAEKHITAITISILEETDGDLKEAIYALTMLKGKIDNERERNITTRIIGLLRNLS